jgi:predicted PurR-regulated permease PerM
LLIFFAVFGGLNVFGFLGLFIGPVILAVTITLLGMLRDETRTPHEHETSAATLTVSDPGPAP